MTQHAKDKCQPPEFPPSTYTKHAVGFRGSRIVGYEDPTRLVVVFKDMDKLIALLGNMLAGKRVFEGNQLSDL